MLCTQCRGLRHHLALKVESCGIPQVAVGNLWFHSSNYRDGSEPLMVSQESEASFLIARDTLGILLELWQGNQFTSGVEAEIPACVSCCDKDHAVCIDFPGVSGIISC